jgi:hypothetical protein
MYEQHSQPLISRKAFLLRMLAHTLGALLIIVSTLLIGILGYHILAGFTWIDSLLNASMILGGMGPVDPVTTSIGKVFASIYALFSGIIFLVVVGVLFAPLFHRFLHRFHMELDEE